MPYEDDDESSETHPGLKKRDVDRINEFWAGKSKPKGYKPLEPDKGHAMPMELGESREMIKKRYSEHR